MPSDTWALSALSHRLALTGRDSWRPCQWVTLWLQNGCRRPCCQCGSVWTRGPTVKLIERLSIAAGFTMWIFHQAVVCESGWVIHTACCLVSCPSDPRERGAKSKPIGNQAFRPSLATVFGPFLTICSIETMTDWGPVKSKKGGAVIGTQGYRLFEPVTWVFTGGVHFG